MSDVAIIENFVKKYAALKQEIAKVIIGQEEVVKLLLTSIFCQGHSLLVGVPGLAKTLLISTISKRIAPFILQNGTVPCLTYFLRAETENPRYSEISSIL